LLAHHADDQAETVMLRLIRGGGFNSLSGMSPRTEMSGVTLLRPLLTVRRDELRAFLNQLQQPWREDASNARDDQARNRARKVLVDRPELSAALCEVAANCRRLQEWAAVQSPTLHHRFAVSAIWNLPEIVADLALGRWLRERGVPSDEVSSHTIRELLLMCVDAASPARISAAGGLSIRRRGGEVYVE
jgi:hypothetical protein